MSKLWPHQDRRWKNIEVPRLCTPGQWFFPRHCKKNSTNTWNVRKKGVLWPKTKLEKDQPSFSKTRGNYGTDMPLLKKKKRTFVFWLFDNFLLLSKFPSFQPLWLWGHFYFGTVVWKCWKIIKKIKKFSCKYDFMWNQF